MSTYAREWLALEARRGPGVVTLARRLSLTVRAEPALVRETRLAAALDAVTESDLWFSDLVASAGPLGIALDPAIADELRSELTDDEREDAWARVQRHHGRSPWSIRLEERINYLTAGGGDASEIDELMAAALDELHDQDERAALGIARWLLAALTRLPDSARASPSVAAASVVAGAQVDGFIGDLEGLTDEQRATWLPKLLGDLGTTTLPVRLLPDGLALGGDAGDAVPLPVPRTDPLALTVEWADGRAEVRLRAGEERHVPLPRGEVLVRTIAGEETLLRPLGLGRVYADGRDVAPGCVVGDRLVATAAEPIAGASQLLFAFDDGVTTTCFPRPRVTADVAYLELDTEPTGGPPLIAPGAGVRWRFADGRPGRGMVVSVGGHYLMLDHEDVGAVEPGAALVAEEPWGAVFGIVLGGEAPHLRASAIDIESTDPALTSLPDEPPFIAAGGPRELGLEFHPVIHRYVPRDVDEELDRALDSPGLVLVEGPPGSGRTRTLWEAIQRSGRELVVPRDRLVHLGRQETPGVIWLGDLTGDLARPRNGTAVATTTDAARFPGAVVVRLPGRLSPEEHERAWELMGPELDLISRLPWAGDELEMRAGAVERTRRERDPQRLARALLGYGQALQNARRIEEAIGALDESLTLWREQVADLGALAENLLALATAYGSLARFDEAIRLADEGLSSRQAIGDPDGVHWAMLQLAGLLSRAERTADAVATAEAAVRQAQEFPDERGQQRFGHALETLAYILSDANDERAIDVAQQVVDARRRLGDPVMEAHALSRLSTTFEQFGRSFDAVEASQAALEIFRAIDAVRDVINVLGNLARQNRILGDYKPALEASGEAIELARSAAGEWAKEALAFQLLEEARLQELTGRDRPAADAATEAVSLWSELAAADPERNPWYSSALDLGIDLTDRAGRLEFAITFAERRLDLLDRIGTEEQIASARQRLDYLQAL